MTPQISFINRWFARFTSFGMAGFVLALLAAGVVTAAHAASGISTQTASNGLWSATGNWSGGIVADGTDSTADFSTIDISADNGVHLDSSRTIGLLKTGEQHDWLV